MALEIEMEDLEAEIEDRGVEIIEINDHEAGTKTVVAQRRK